MLTVDKTTCRQCGMCAGVCSGKIIAFREKNYPRKMPGFDLLCIKCGHCVAVCPTASLTHQYVPLEKCPPIKKELFISPAQCEQLIRARRSIRAYQDRPVPRELVQRLIDMAHYAPTGHNNQEVEWLVIDDRKTLMDIEKAAVGWLKEMIEKQPQMAAMMNFKGLLIKQEKDFKEFLRGAPALVCAIAPPNSPIALIDSIIAMTTLELAATSLGLGGCWAGMVYFMAGSYPPVQAALGIPAGRSGYGFMMLGFPAFRYSRMVARRDATIIWRP